MQLHGPFPTKKNRLRPRIGGRRGQMYDPAVKEFIDRLAMEARGEWGSRRELVHPKVEIQFFISNPAKDRDGLWTTVLDALKRARVIFDDSIRWYNGPELKHPAVIVATARLELVKIVLEDTQ